MKRSLDTGTGIFRWGALVAVGVCLCSEDTRVEMLPPVGMPVFSFPLNAPDARAPRERCLLAVLETPTQSVVGGSVAVGLLPSGGLSEHYSCLTPVRWTVAHG